MNYHGKLIRNGTVVMRPSSPNYLVTMELQIASSIFYKRLISYRGLVKWYNNGLQNHCWEFDSLIPCHLEFEAATVLFFILFMQVMSFNRTYSIL